MQAWENFLTILETELGLETVQCWLRPLKVQRFDACNLYLEAKDSFQTMWFEEHIRKKIQTNLRNNNGKKIKVHLQIANAPQVKSIKTKQKAPKAPPLSPKFVLQFDETDPQTTMDQFIVTEGSLLAYKLLCRVAGFNADNQSVDSRPPELGVFNPIYLYGREGAGKTHLLMACINALRQHGLKVIYSRAETFTEHVVSAIRSGEMSTFRQAYRNADVLLIDDVHVFSRKGATQEELFHTFNALHISGKQIILSANCAPGELQLIEPRLVSRFEWGIVLSVDPLVNEEREYLLKMKADALNCLLPPKVAEFLLDTFKSNTKALCRALEALILRTHVHQQNGNSSANSMTVANVSTLLADLITEEQQKELTPEDVVEAVAGHYGIRKEDLLGKSQNRDCVLPRQLAMHLCRTHLNLSYTKIGEAFNKDHSTVMSSVKVIQKAIDLGDQDISATRSLVLKKLQN